MVKPDNVKITEIENTIKKIARKNSGIWEGDTGSARDIITDNEEVELAANDDEEGVYA